MLNPPTPPPTRDAPPPAHKRGLWAAITGGILWRSVFRHGWPNTQRNRVLVILSNVFLHIQPVTIAKSALRVRYTWYMGFITGYLFLVEVITGYLLMFYYRPTAEYAYQDIVYLREDVPLGVMREIHRWAAHAMVIAVWLHMLRVFLTGSYKHPRQFNWVIGVVLLVLTLLLSFTGYLLPWDQLAIWAITVGSNMARATPGVGHEGPGASLLNMLFDDVTLVHAGNDARFGLIAGRFIGAAALLRFYVLHCVALPFFCFILICVHLWRVRKDGGISCPP
jgi:quinol-cytochrome oxidoreductase complex cytochrome b subunit